MTVITINGQIGTGGPEISAEVARRLGFDYVDRLILAEAVIGNGRQGDAA